MEKFAAIWKASVDILKHLEALLVLVLVLALALVSGLVVVQAYVII